MDWNSITDVRHYLAVEEKASGPCSLEVAHVLTKLADLYFIAEQYLEAEPLYWQALEIKKQVLGQYHLEVAALLKNIAEVYEMEDRSMEARQLYQWSADIEANEQATVRKKPDSFAKNDRQLPKSATASLR